MIGDFHFIRPLWLLALVPLGLLAWLMFHRQDTKRRWRGVISPHLLPFLLSGEKEHQRLSPIVMIAAGWLLAVIAIAGPTWRPEPAPFADDTAALAIIVKVTPSMMTEDVQPSRLARAVEKIHDLLAQRPGAKTSLIAYAGSAHVVMPATTDGGIIDSFAGSLDPKIMPADGDNAAAALRLADESLAGSGSILWITDGIAAEEKPLLAKWRAETRTPVRLLPPLLNGPERDALAKIASSVDADIVHLSADDSDVIAIARAAKFVPTASGEATTRWQEMGYWISPVLVALTLFFFRKGWMVPAASIG